MTVFKMIVVKFTVGQMTLGKMTVFKMIVVKFSVGKLTLGKMTRQNDKTK